MGFYIIKARKIINNNNPIPKVWNKAGLVNEENPFKQEIVKWKEGKIQQIKRSWYDTK